MNKFFRILRKTETIITVISMIAFTIVGFLQVFFRVFLKSPLAWSEEACRYLFIWSMMLGAILVAAENGHFRVDFLVSKLPDPLQRITTGLSCLLMAVFSLLIIYYGYKLMMSNTTRVSPALGIRMMYIYLIFPINGILVLLHLAEGIVKGGKEK
ncbi:TRAP transporter small permease [bacterium D16-54]|nr:TRAP transporter small permease [bacterium D16-54]RKJ13888.1 TRAP transporter small permease [bacterium D16-56]